MPLTFEFEPKMTADSAMSSALPAGAPSRMSVSTTSARPASWMRCAVVDPTKPPPTTVTFFRITSPCRASSRRRMVYEIATMMRRRGSAAELHVFDDRAREFAGLEFGGAGEHALQVVGDLLLLNRLRDAFFDHHGHLFPAHEFEHH